MRMGKFTSHEFLTRGARDPSTIIKQLIRNISAQYLTGRARANLTFQRSRSARVPL